MKLQKVEEKHKQFVTLLGPKVTKHNKSWSEYSAQYKRQQKKQIASDVCTALKFTEKPILNHQTLKWKTLRHMKYYQYIRMAQSQQ